MMMKKGSLMKLELEIVSTCAGRQPKEQSKQARSAEQGPSFVSSTFNPSKINSQTAVAGNHLHSSRPVYQRLKSTNGLSLHLTSTHLRKATIELMKVFTQVCQSVYKSDTILSEELSTWLRSYLGRKVLRT